MNNILKRSIASLTAIVSLSLCTVANFANASNTQNVENATIIENSQTTRSYHSLYLTNTKEQLLETIIGPKNITLYAHPTGGSVSLSVYQRHVDDLGNYYYTFVDGYSYDASGYAPSHTVYVSSGTYCVFVRAHSATASNPVTGYANIT